MDYTSKELLGSEDGSHIFEVITYACINPHMHLFNELVYPYVHEVYGNYLFFC